MRLRVRRDEGVRKCIETNLVLSDWGEAPKIKVAQNGLKHILVLEFLKSDEICEIGQISVFYTISHRHHSDQTTCSALETTRLKTEYAVFSITLYIYYFYY